MNNNGSERLVVRFAEESRYCIRRDCEVVRFMAVTGYGTYHAEVRAGGPRSLRRDRQAFRERAIAAMQAGMPPHEIALEAMH